MAHEEIWHAEVLVTVAIRNRETAHGATFNSAKEMGEAAERMIAEQLGGPCCGVRSVNWQSAKPRLGEVCINDAWLQAALKEEQAP